MKILLLPLFAAILAYGCGSLDANEQAETAPVLQKGFVAGRVIDANGKGISGVRIYVDNTIFYNSGINTTTDTRGYYRVKTPPGSWRVFADMIVPYNNREYKLALHPEQNPSFTGEEGAIKNFEWKVCGESVERSSFYGGTVAISRDANSAMHDFENIEFTFNPVNRLIDGTIGKVLVRKADPLQPGSQPLIYDVPISRYRVSAIHVPTQKPLKLRNGKCSEDEFESSIVLDFYGTDSPTGLKNAMFLEYTDK